MKVNKTLLFFCEAHFLPFPPQSNSRVFLLGDYYECFHEREKIEVEKMRKNKLVPMEPTKAMIDAARDHHEGEPYLPVSLYKAMLAAAPDVQGEPVACAVFANNGSIRIWCGDPTQVGTLRQQYGEALQLIYAAPQLAEQPAPDLLDALQLIASAKDRGFGIDYATGCAKAALAATAKEVVYD